MLQKPFMWNNNNPVEYSDPSGYDIGYIDPGLANTLANMINGSTIFRSAFIRMAQDSKVTYNFTIGNAGGNPGQSTLSQDNKIFTMEIAPGSAQQEEDEEAHEGAGHGGLLATEGSGQFRSDADPHHNNMCAAGQTNGCTNNEIKSQQTQRGVDNQLGIQCSCPYQANTSGSGGTGAGPSEPGRFYDANTEQPL